MPGSIKNVFRVVIGVCLATQAFATAPVEMKQNSKSAKPDFSAPCFSPFDNLNVCYVDGRLQPRPISLVSSGKDPDDAFMRCWNLQNRQVIEASGSFAPPKPVIINVFKAPIPPQVPNLATNLSGHLVVSAAMFPDGTCDVVGADKMESYFKAPQAVEFQAPVLRQNSGTQRVYDSNKLGH